MKSIQRVLLALVLGGAFWCLPGRCAQVGITVEDLRCELRVNPLGIDVVKPRLGWVIQADRRAELQTAYQVLAASSEGSLARDAGDLWDSGRVESSDSIHVTYAGKPLRSGQRVWWKVRVWGRSGECSRFSPSAWFETALLAEADWKASWIQAKSPGPVPDVQMFNDHPAPLLRKEFTCDRRVRQARAYVSGLGYYELRLNGKRVGDQVLDPGWTSYGKRVLYSTYDVTDQVRRGRNALGLCLGNGWFNPLPLRLWGSLNLRDALLHGEPRAILQLVIEYADGTSRTVVTDGTWRVSEGPVRRDNVYLGEVYDARREQAGWDRPGFDDSDWTAAVRADAPVLGPLRAQDAPPIRVTRILKPVALTEPKPGVFVFDLGQNFAGWVQLRARGPSGTRIRLRYGELLYPDGTLNGMTAVCGQIKGGGKADDYDGVGQPRTAFQRDEFVLRGQGTEEFTPRFTFHGFRYVEVTGYPGRPGLDALVGCRLNADVANAGSFECSNELFNRIQQMVLWTELSNLFSVQSDCPHREKFGYGGDIVASSEMAMLNFDMARFYAKAAQDLVDAVRPNGGFTETSPFVGISDEGLGERSGPIGWGTAQPLLLVQLRQYYGEERLLREQYEATKRWVALLRSRAQDGLLDNGISDHESLVPKPRALTGTAFYYLNATLLAQLATALGEEADARDAATLAEEIEGAFNRKFLVAGTGRYDTATQACQAFALYHHLVPAAEQARALDVLVRDVAQQGDHLTTGIFGTKYLLEALTQAGRADLAYRIVNQRTFPGWGHMLEQGATTLWEHWEFSDNTFSHNHPMFGSVSEWFYKALAGIQPAPDAVGFDKILIRPQPVGDLRWARASHDTVRGRITSAWEKVGARFKLRVTIPANAQARVYVPATDARDVLEGDRAATSALGVEFEGTEGGAAVFRVGSGTYEFTAPASSGP
jgi:alpha-L-rhamnosidase